MSSVNMPTVVALSKETANADATVVATLSAPFAGKLVSATIGCVTAASAADAVFDVSIGGVSVFLVDGDKVTVTDGDSVSAVTPVTAAAAVVDFAAGAVITVTCDTASSTAGTTAVLVLDADLNPTD
jgi:hypothetical protein